MQVVFVWWTVCIINHLPLLFLHVMFTCWQPAVVTGQDSCSPWDWSKLQHAAVAVQKCLRNSSLAHISKQKKQVLSSQTETHHSFSCFLWLSQFRASNSQISLSYIDRIQNVLFLNQWGLYKITCLWSTLAGLSTIKETYKQSKKQKRKSVINFLQNYDNDNYMLVTISILWHNQC